MSVLRFVTFVALMALMVPLGSTSATATPSSVPNGLIDSPALDLRAAGSRLVVETVEEVLRQGGLALFEEGFQLDSSLNWVFGETIEGEADAVVPLLDRDGHVVFAQPGFAFWTGLGEEERADGNLGFVYRTKLANTHLGVDAVGGASVFYDHDFKNGHGRAGFGADIQSGVFHGAFNYYHPLTGTRDGREGFVEDALRGVDFRVALEREVMRVSANLGYWRFKGDEELKGNWKSSYGFDAGIRIVPGVFLEGGWERHDETVSLDRRWNAGLAFRFSLPDFEGASYGGGSMSSNLWKVVEREKRILYEERLGIPRVNIPDVVYGDAGDQRVGAVSEGNTVTVMAELGKPLDEDVTLNIIVAETSTAEFGADKDFTYGYKVYELDAATGEQSAPANTEPCMEEMCAVPVPAGVTRFDIEADIRADSVAQEIPKFIDFQIEVPEEHAGLLRDSFVERITLRGHGNTVEFASAASTLGENGGTVDVAVSANLASPRPITLNVSATSTNAVEGVDYTISSGSLTIPASISDTSSASLRLMGINNDRGEGSKTIELEISGALPDGWMFGTQTTHTVTLEDDDLSIFFVTGAGATPSRVEEPGSDNTSVMVTVGITQPPSESITVRVASEGPGETAREGSGMDYTFTATDLTFSPTDHANKTTTLMVLSDTAAELEQTIVLTLADMGTRVAREADGFSLGGPHTITIPANDNTVSVASDAADTLVEDNETTGVQVSVSVAMPSPTPITLNVATSGTAIEGQDYRISSKTLRIDANAASSNSLTLWGEDNTGSDGNKEITLTFTGNLPEGWSFASDPFTHTVTLQDDDLNVGFVDSTGEIEEPGTGSTQRQVAVRLSQTPAQNITLTVNASGGTGIDSNDYSVGNSVTFTPSDTTTDSLTKNLAVTINSDTMAELNEEITLTLEDRDGHLTAGGNNFSIGQATHVLTILANDNTVSIDTDNSDSTLEEDGTANIVVSVDMASPTDIMLSVSATSTDAVENTDYSFPATLRIPANSSTGTLTVTGINDNDEQGRLTVDFTLAGDLPEGWDFADADGMATSLTHQMTITDNEVSAIGWASSVSTALIPASGSTTTHILTVDVGKAPTTDRLSISVKLGGSSGGSGYLVEPSANGGCGNIVTRTSNQAPYRLRCNVVVLANAVPDSTLTLTIEGTAEVQQQLASENIVISPATHTVTFVESPRVSIDSMSDSTLDEDGGTASVVVKVNNPAPNAITLSVSPASTSTAEETTHYTLSPSTLTLAANDDTATAMLTITGVDNNTFESTPRVIDLEFTGTLPSGWNFNPDPLIHKVTITDDERSVGWTAATLTHVNERLGSETLTLMVKLSGPVSEAIRLNINPNLGTATSTSGVGAPDDDFAVALDEGRSTCGGRSPNLWVEFPANATGNDLTQSCMLHIRDSAVTKNIIMELSDANSNLGRLKTVINPSRIEIMVVNP